MTASNMRETPKFNLWVRYFTDPSDKSTFCNATKAAMKAYNTNSYSTAGVIGSKNIKKYKNLSVMTLDIQGYDFDELMRLGIEKVKKGSYEDWDKFMMRLGYFANKL